ncbi:MULTISPECIES: ATP-binding cassette domain-containing protein [Halocynthiibacter]|uniref:ABC transporter ATP-binding protein n=1 Tax=Halocynthiibacter halioticoli TaxID=2986804 RepID=A0AAE3IXM7_9RHOB|nr:MULTISPECIES: ABC transporter ATP-binding protein [Halocynthiibacter]MCV6822980.1 ABC transporter ATP-binding protein [Halocynthiibacter halioticoli]MCW4055981.1 ABC transporter ATP-binding protein [Halocynthiibacter sp. SDUM655004]
MTDVVVSTRSLTRTFGEKTAVDNLDLEIQTGQIYGFLGPNGCGKTTTIRMLTGLLTPSSGEVTVLGKSMPQAAEPLKSQIGYMTQIFSYYRDLTVRENLKFAAEIYGIPARSVKGRIEELLHTYDLTTNVDQLCGSLSGGQRQKLSLAATVIHRPKLLFLDEPTSAVDPETRRTFWEQLFDLVDEGATMIVSTHFMDEAERCHKLAILQNGAKKADGSPRQLMDNLQADVVEIEGPELRTVKHQLDGKPKVLSTAQIGSRLRVLVDKSEPQPVEMLRALLNTFSDLTLTQQRPNLEDVFVSATREQKA